MNEHEHRHDRRDDVAAYALGALPPAEAAELERHLADCERCREQLRWLEPAVDTLPEGVERREPPPALRERLMAEVRADAASQAGRARRGETTGWISRLRAGELGWKPAAALAAAALALVALAGYEVGGGGDSGPATTTVSAGQAPGVVATVVSEGDSGTLRLANVEALPQGKVLEAWVERDGRVEAVPALFAPDRTGRASTTIADMDGVETVMVTEEPQGGSAAPTGEPIVALSMRQ
ncbi:MAG TPA: anti-sigma factor [Solirubrobacterales bacterium]|nr:anti-sigma factor [Solirubrobacterales bacterium]